MTIKTEEFMALKVALGVLSEGRELTEQEKKYLDRAENAIKIVDMRQMEYNKRQAEVMRRRRNTWI